jgi:hypothetical protein
MRQKSGPEKQPAEDAIRDIRRVIRQYFSAEEKIRIVLEGLRGEESRAGLCHVNLNWPREVSTTQFDFMWLSQLAMSRRLPLARRGGCGGM